jgi:hypothetical protein
MDPRRVSALPLSLLKRKVELVEHFPCGHPPKIDARLPGGDRRREGHAFPAGKLHQNRRGLFASSTGASLDRDALANPHAVEASGVADGQGAAHKATTSTAFTEWTVNEGWPNA